MNILNIKGNTFCIDTGTLYIPFYKINDEQIIMMDTGWKEERAGIERLVESNNLRIAAILNSHAHRDHIGNNAYFKDKYNCIIAMPASEAFICRSAANLKLFFNELALSDVKRDFGHLICKTDIMIEEDQDSISLYGADFKIVHTPGHSQDHICIVTPDDVAYLGDSLVGYELIAEAKLPYAYILSDDLNSKAKLHELKCSKYAVSHKGIFDDISKLIDDNISFYKARAAKINELISTGMTMEDSMEKVCRSLRIRIDSVDKYIHTERKLKPYLDYLYETGKLRIYEEDGLLKFWEWR
jgi:glyoxylase-like metal-dependent hydrolase (beta-lactamase superfamily II)